MQRRICWYFILLIALCLSELPLNRPYELFPIKMLSEFVFINEANKHFILVRQNKMYQMLWTQKKKNLGISLRHNWSLSFYSGKSQNGMLKAFPELNLKGMYVTGMLISHQVSGKYSGQPWGSFSWVINPFLVPSALSSSEGLILLSLLCIVGSKGSRIYSLLWARNLRKLAASLVGMTTAYQYQK